MTFFRRGAFFTFEKHDVLIEEDEFKSSVSVIVGMPKGLSGAQVKYELECEDLLSKVFDAICDEVANSNPFRSLTKMLISVDGMLKGKEVLYTYEDVQKCYSSGSDIIFEANSEEDNSIRDTLDSLLTDKEKKVIIVI